MMILRSITIGRAEGCDLRVDDEYASPRHCRIDEHDNGEFTVTDLGSTNGTYLKHESFGVFAKIPLGGFDRLRPGDVVRVGRTEIPWKNT